MVEVVGVALVPEAVDAVRVGTAAAGAAVAVLGALDTGALEEVVEGAGGATAVDALLWLVLP